MTRFHFSEQTRLGWEVGPQPPQQDMYEIDQLAGVPHDRDASPADFTGGTGGAGLGGQAEPAPDGVFYEKIGF